MAFFNSYVKLPEGSILQLSVPLKGSPSGGIHWLLWVFFNICYRQKKVSGSPKKPTVSMDFSPWKWQFLGYPPLKWTTPNARWNWSIPCGVRCSDSTKWNSSPSLRSTMRTCLSLFDWVIIVFPFKTTIFGGCPMFEHKVLQASWPAWASPVADATFSRWIWVNSMDPATGSGYILYTQPSNVGEKTTSLTHPSWWNSEVLLLFVTFCLLIKIIKFQFQVVLLQTSQVLGGVHHWLEARCISTKPSIHEITVWGSSNVVEPQRR